MRLPLLSLLIASSGLALAAGPPAATPRHLFMVVSKGIPGMTLYDADTEKVICRAKMGVSPHEGAFSQDGKYAYVPVYGSSGVGKPGTDEHSLYFINTDGCATTMLDTGKYKRPHGVLVGKSGKLYVTAEVAKSVIIVDPKTKKIVGEIPTDSATTHTMALSDDESKIYTSNVQSKTVSVLNVPEKKLQQVVPTTSENQRMTISDDNRWFVTSLGPEKKIAFYRTSDNKLDFTIPIEGHPFVGQFSADGKYLYNAGTTGDGQIHAYKIDVAQRKQVAMSEPLGKYLGTLRINPFTKKVYVSVSGEDHIFIIDPETWKVEKKMDTDKTPDAMLFASKE